MKKTSILILISLITSAFVFGGDIAPLGKQLQKKYISMSENDQTVVVIYLTDKGDIGKYKVIQAQSFLTERSIQRRLKVRTPDAVIDERDYPLHQIYVYAIGENVLQIRHQLKWFNAISAIATKSQIEIIRKFNFVKEIELVGQWKKDKESEKEQSLEKVIAPPEPSGTTSFNYGTSFIQVNQINVPIVHDKGIYGQGVIVGVFDNGFRILNHESFATMNIIAQRDFVDHKESVIPYNPSHGGHGVNTLSTVGGFRSGQLIGPAFGADYILARTENDSSETPIEEDYWAAAIEWADSIGVDVTSTSLGYLTYDAPYTSWTWEDMDGNTTLITKAADHAVSLGIVIVNSAGNNGYTSEHNTLNAPADGDSVIAAGAVTSAGERSSFSSVGPTTDYPARIKPDIMAMGSGVKVASSSDPFGYGSANGTSFSCPLSAGVAALILSANPTLTPMQVRDAMLQTAGNAAVPDNLMGWGILNADSAIRYYGILPLGTVSGTVYADLNSNGIKDPEDTSLTGIKIYLTGSATDSTYTDESGNYNFDSLAIGAYTISQEILTGWKQTTPLLIHSFYLLHMDDTSGLDFGNFRLAIIRGSKFNDLNANGIQDGLESGMDNWVFTLSNGDTSYRSVTQDGGTFTFSDIDTGTYAISESIRVGWFQTIPLNYGSYTISINRSLDTSGFIFGNHYIPDSMYRITYGWNMLSFPKIVSDYSIFKYYPTAESDPFIYSNGYVGLDTIPPKTGYWLKSSATQNVIIQGSPRLVDTLNLVEGWNLVGSIDDTIPKSSLVQIPDTIIGTMFCFKNGLYYQQEPDSDLYPHQGYWIKARTNGMIVMNASWKNQQSVLNKPPVEVFKPSNTITFTDDRGIEQKLYFGFDAEHLRMQEFFELPPLPPDGIFDARFDNNLTLAATHKVQSTKNILIQSTDYPITIRWVASDHRAYLTIDGKQIELNGDGKAIIAEKPMKVSLTLDPSDVREIPKTFALEQNFPNPFNPLTSIRYQLPVSGWVTVKVYNSFGQEMVTLVDGPQEAGYKSVEWDASQFASGVYFYRLIAGSFISTKKMVLIR